MLPGHGGAEPRAPQRDGEGGGNGTCGVAEGEDGEAEAADTQAGPRRDDATAGRRTNATTVLDSFPLRCPSSGC